jgi:hypothetical protein
VSWADFAGHSGLGKFVVSGTGEGYDVRAGGLKRNFGRGLGYFHFTEKRLCLHRQLRPYTQSRDHNFSMDWLRLNARRSLEPQHHAEFVLIL